jgi:excisionase family DNA binding protein
MTKPEAAANKLLDQVELCDRLGISRTKLYELRQQGYLTPIRVSPRNLRWRESDVEAFIEASRETAAQS